MGIAPEVVMWRDVGGYRWCCMWRDIGARIQR